MAGTARASIPRILWNDWPALFSALAIPIVWAIHAAFPWLRRGGTSPLWLALLLTALAGAALAWRIGRIQALFARGRRAPGTIRRVKIVRDRGRLEFEFRPEGAVVEAWSAVHKTRDVLALAPGDQVEVLYDPAAPARAIVRGLFDAAGPARPRPG